MQTDIKNEYKDGPLGEDPKPETPVLLGIRIGIHKPSGKVVVEFSSPTAWFGVDPMDAVKLAEILLQKAYIITQELGREPADPIVEE